MSKLLKGNNGCKNENNYYNFSLIFQIAQADVPWRENKRKQGDEDGTLALPMDERLHALVLDKPTDAAATHPPKTDNQIHLLLQVSHEADKLPKLYSR